MKQRERVHIAISGREPDRVPKGEFWLGDALVQGVLGVGKPVDFQMRKSAWDLLEMDLLAIDCVRRPGITDEDPMGALAHITRWSRETNLYVFALVGGSFSDIMWQVGWREFMEGIKSDPTGLSALSRAWCREQALVAGQAAEAGANAILIGDDLAHSRGLFVSPRDLRALFLPHLVMIVEAAARHGLPVFLHSDGDIQPVLDDLISMGVNGIHPVEPQAMDLGDVKAKYGTRLCLMGNVDTGLLATGGVEAVTAATRASIRVAAPGARYILGSSGGFLDREVSPGNLVAMCKAATRAGVYPLPQG